MADHIFGPSTPVGSLHADYLTATSVWYDWSERSPGDDWDYWESLRCPDCGKVTPGFSGEWSHWDLDDEADCVNDVWAEGPMMSYYWPVGLRRIGAPEEAARELVDLPVCIVRIYDDERGSYGLAFTGGGMDMSWELAEAYMRLGLLPPIDVAANLPTLGGLRLDATHKWVLRGCRASLREHRAAAASRCRYGLQKLKRLEDRIAANTLRFLRVPVGPFGWVESQYGVLLGDQPIGCVDRETFGGWHYTTLEGVRSDGAALIRARAGEALLDAYRRERAHANTV